MSFRSDPPGWWRDIPGTGGKYQCSREGEICRVLKDGRRSALAPYAKRRGGLAPKRQVHMRIDGRDRIQSLMSVIVSTWLPPPPPGMCYHHANGNTSDNRLSNIKLISRRALGEKTGHRSMSRAVEKIDAAGNVVALYRSTREAARAEHMSYEAIGQRCRGLIKRPYALNGYTYRYERS